MIDRGSLEQLIARTRAIARSADSEGEPVYALSGIDAARLIALAGLVQGTMARYVKSQLHNYKLANDDERAIWKIVEDAGGMYVNEQNLPWPPDSTCARLYKYLKTLRLVSEDVRIAVEVLLDEQKSEFPDGATVANKPRNVPLLPQMEVYGPDFAEIFRKLTELNEVELADIRRRIDRYVFMKGRPEEEAKILRKLASTDAPPKFKDRRSDDDVISFIRREYGNRDLLNGFLTRKILRDYDVTCEAELSRYVRHHELPADIKIPKAINFPNDANVRSRFRDRTIS